MSGCAGVCATVACPLTSSLGLRTDLVQPWCFHPVGSDFAAGTLGACGMGTTVHRASDREESLLPATFQ